MNQIKIMRQQKQRKSVVVVAFVASSSFFVAEGTRFVPYEREWFQQTSQLREHLRPSEVGSIGRRRQPLGQPWCRRDDQGSEVRVAS